MGLLSALFGGGKPEENQQEKQEQKNFEILKYDGIRARNMNQLAYAAKCLEQAAALRDDAETLQFLADVYIKMNRMPDARIVLDKLKALEPGNVRALLTLAHVCYMQEDYEGVKAVCQQVIGQDADNAEAYYLAAKAEYELRNDLQAIVLSTKALALNEGFIPAYQFRAEVLWKMRQAKEALEDLDRILASNPEEEEALLLKGTIEVAQGNAGEAYACIDKVMEVNPFNEKAYLLKGGMLCEEKAFGKAIEVYTEALELMPGHAVFYQERGRVRLLAGDKDGSVEDMKKVIELNPESGQHINGEFKN